MQAKLTKPQAKAFVRAIQDTMEKVAAQNSGKRYVVSFGTSCAIPQVEQTASEVKSLLSKLDSMINQYPESSGVNVTVDIQESKGIDYQVMQGTKELYESSEKIQEGAEVGKKVHAKSQAKKIEVVAK